MGKKIDLTGHRFGRLVVIREAGRKNGHVVWLCRCDCGNEVTVRGNCLTSGHTSSCGCFQRDRTSEASLKHPIRAKHNRLFRSVCDHFRKIVNREDCYRYWTLDQRYSPDPYGVERFCIDLIAHQPEMCERYEKDKSLDLDKDNGNLRVFRPECVKFVSIQDNRSKQLHNLKLSDGTPFGVFCRSVGVKTCEGHMKKTLLYDKYKQWFLTHNGEGHPELIKRANELIALYTKTLKLLQLLEDVRLLRACVQKSLSEPRN